MACRDIKRGRKWGGGAGAPEPQVRALSWTLGTRAPG